MVLIYVDLENPESLFYLFIFISGIELFKLMEKARWVYMWHIVKSHLALFADLKHENMPDSCGETYAADKLELKQLGIHLEVIRG